MKALPSCLRAYITRPPGGKQNIYSDISEYRFFAPVIPIAFPGCAKLMLSDSLHSAPGFPGEKAQGFHIVRQR